MRECGLRKDKGEGARARARAGALEEVLLQRPPACRFAPRASCYWNARRLAAPLSNRTKVFSPSGVAAGAARRASASARWECLLNPKPQLARRAMPSSRVWVRADGEAAKARKRERREEAERGAAEGRRGRTSAQGLDLDRRASAQELHQNDRAALAWSSSCSDRERNDTNGRGARLGKADGSFTSSAPSRHSRHHEPCNSTITETRGQPRAAGATCGRRSCSLPRSGRASRFARPRHERRPQLG